MIPVISISIAVLVGLIWAAIVLVRRLGAADSHLPVTAQWIEELTPDRYAPMLRLLNSDDIEFLRAQPGFTPKLESRLRAQRCQIFRGYLRCLDTDFQRVCTALKLILVDAGQDRPDLSAVLVHHQIMFASGLMAVNFRLLLYRWGICSVDVSSLVQIFDVMRIELRTLVPSTMAACA